MTREPIYQGLFEFFSVLAVGTAPAFKTATRKLKHWEEVQPEDQPALLVRQDLERAERRKGLPTKWTGRLWLALYVHTGAHIDPGVVPSQLLNPLVDAIEAAITPDDIGNYAATLSGLVSHIAIEGDIQYFEGNLGDEAVVLIPIQFVTA